jgi:uncharacterized membrane protein
LVYLAASITPPYQSPDEPNHFARAEQISRSELVSAFVYNKSAKTDSISADKRIEYPSPGGFSVDKGVYEMDSLFLNIKFHSGIKVSPATLDGAKSIKWRNEVEYQNFGNTTIYPPLVYIMPAIGISMGKLFGLSVYETLHLSRILNGMLCIALSFFALLLGKRSNILMFIVLLFPMTVSLFGSVSQDAVLIACSFLMVGIIDDMEFGSTPSYKKWHLYALIILACIIGTAKPPYILFVFPFLFLKYSPRIKAIIISLPILVVIAWLFINHTNYAIKWAPPESRLNAKLQMMHIIEQPFRFMSMFFKFDQRALNDFSHMFVGVLGWLDLQFTNFYYIVAYVVLVMGFITGLRNSHNNNKLIKPALYITFLITLVAVLTAQYVTWTALDEPTLNGMQGRYVLPIFPFLALALSSAAGEEKMLKLKKWFFALILLFPMFTLLNLVDGLLKRYYWG